MPKARPLSKHVPLWLWLRCRYPAGRAGLLDAGLFLRVLLAKAKKPARSRPGVCLGWYLRTGFLCFFALAINVSGGYLPQNRPLAPSTASGPPSSRRKAGSLLCRVMDYGVDYCRFPETRKGCPYGMLHRNHCIGFASKHIFAAAQGGLFCRKRALGASTCRFGCGFDAGTRPAGPGC